MALPAGRYGVTKNQLLKIKKLPMNTIKLIEELTEKYDLLGTAAFKNSTSVVTDSSDLVESGAVKDIVGWGNKNLSIPYNYTTTVSDFTITYENNKVVANGETGNIDVIYPVSSVARNNGYVLDLPAGTYTVSLTGDTTNLEPQIVKASDGSVLVGTTITLNTLTTIFVRVMVKKNNTFNNQICYIQLEKGSTATAYEPYHASVDETKADNSVIGTVEGANASKAWSVGEYFVKDGQFKEVTAPIASGEAINSGNTTDKPIADCLPTRVEDITSEFTFSTDCSWVANWTKVKKNGRMITVVLRFTTPSTVSPDKSIITFPAKYKPIQLNDYSFSMAGLLGKAFSGERAGLATFYVSGNEYGIRLASNEWLANTAVVTQFTYMI